MDPPRWLLSIAFRPGRMLVFSLVLAALSVRTLMHFERHNPNSHFFDPTPDTFAGPYSDARKAQARAWIDLQDSMLQGTGNAHVTLYNDGKHSSDAHAVPDLKVVFLASRRPGEQYLDAALGSLLLELKPEQRQRMHITVSLSEDDPMRQPFFNSAWLHGLTDEVSVRSAPQGPYLPPALSAQKDRPLAKLTVLPRPVTSLAHKDIQTNEWHQRSTVDYSLALELCNYTPAAAGAPHCLVVEDDVVFATQWYDRLEPLVRKADQNWPHDAAASATSKPWGYIRFFYAEKYFGWETEEVRTLVVSCSSVVALVALCLIVFGRFPARYAALSGRPRSDLLHSHRADWDADERKASLTRRAPGGGAKGPATRIRLPLGTQLIVLLMIIFYCVLFILSGRNHVYKIPDGISEMNTRGCCTQANVYAADVVEPLKTYLRTYVGVRPYDILVNRWINTNERVKLAVHPPLVQHIGVGSTHAMVDETYLRSTPLWSFAFEKLSAKAKVPGCGEDTSCKAP